MYKTKNIFSLFFSKACAKVKKELRYKKYSPSAAC